MTTLRALTRSICSRTAAAVVLFGFVFAGCAGSGSLTLQETEHLVARDVNAASGLERLTYQDRFGGQRIVLREGGVTVLELRFDPHGQAFVQVAGRTERQVFAAEVDRVKAEMQALLEAPAPVLTRN